MKRKHGQGFGVHDEDEGKKQKRRKKKALSRSTTENHDHYHHGMLSVSDLPMMFRQRIKALGGSDAGMVNVS